MSKDQRLIDANALEAVFKATHKMIVGMNGDEDCADTVQWAIEKLREAHTVIFNNGATCSCGGKGIAHLMNDIHKPVEQKSPEQRTGGLVSDKLIEELEDLEGYVGGMVPDDPGMLATINELYRRVVRLLKLARAKQNQ